MHVDVSKDNFGQATITDLKREEAHEHCKSIGFEASERQAPKFGFEFGVGGCQIEPWLEAFSTFWGGIFWYIYISNSPIHCCSTETQSPNLVSCYRRICLILSLPLIVSILLSLILRADICRKWMSWYEKNKRRNWHKIDLADSPKKRDVDEVYAVHQERRKKRFARMRTEAKHSGGRAREVSGVQDEAALPEWAYREKTWASEWGSVEKSAKAENMHPFRSGSPCNPILLDSLKRRQCWEQ